MIALYIDCSQGFVPEMLLGALIDMGASPSYIEQCLEEAGGGVQVLHSSVLRHGMEATLAYCTPVDFMQAALFCAVECFSPEYIICGNMPETCGVEQKKLMDKIANEYGPSPDGYIMCDGYGAAPEDVSDCGVLRTVLYNCGEPELMAEFAAESVVTSI